ncbi:alpha/beta fold hydrolase [Paenibacillus humicus]|uniref:alpha/beta fold hydrolase n=1 Tax=Paenibacillus humicus TaxID=412861 RepID=UPI003F1375F8
MPFVPIRDIHVQYDIHNPHAESGTIVFVHGIGLNMSIWEPMLPYFSQSFRLVTFDLRGHGLTEAGTSGLSWGLFVDDMQELFHALELQSFHLVGYGAGASLALKYSLSYKHQILSLAFLAIPAYCPRKPLTAFIQTRKAQAQIHSMRHLGMDMAKSMTGASEDSPSFQSIVSAYGRMNADFYFRFLELYVEDSPFSDYDYISHPALCIIGDQDPLSLTSYTLASRLLRKTRLLIAPHSANAVFLDQPRLACEWIEDFIGKPVLHQRRAYPFNEEENEQVINYFDEVYQEGMKKLESNRVIRIQVLGFFRVSINGESIMAGWNQRYAKSLLLYLALHRSATREQICDALFPDIPLNSALKNLRVYLNHLKKQLEPDGTETAALRMDKEHIALNGIVRCDASKLNEDLDQALVEANPDRQLRQCKELTANLPGTLMSGFYVEWFNEYRLRMENKLVELLKQSAATERRNGNPHGSALLLKKALSYHPEDEQINSLLGS